MRYAAVLGLLCLSAPTGAQADDLVDALAAQIDPAGDEAITKAAQELGRELLFDLTTETPQEAQERAVHARLAEACGNLFAQKPDETITNPLCLEVFLANGLPE